MKNNLLIFILCICFKLSYGTNDSTFFFNEFNFALNYTDVKDHNTQNGFGIGLGIHHVSSKHKRVNFTFGLEYNRTKQYKNIIQPDLYTTISNSTFYLNNLSIPINLRININNNYNFFFNTGIYLNLSLASKRKGFVSKYNKHTSTFDAYYIDERFHYDNIHLGINLAFGARIKLQKGDLIIKPEYRYSPYSTGNPNYLSGNYFRIALGILLIN